ncbi:MAG TPA: DUF3558 domain-containing protein [Aldersonia sp.]
MNGQVGGTRGIRIALAVCIVCAVVGCGSQTVEGNPTAATQSGQPSFDPCTLPDQALVAAGVDPATQDAGVFGVQMQGWEVCGWTGDWFFLDVFSTTRGIEDVRGNPRNTDFAPVAVGSRDAFTYREVTDEERGTCDVAFGTENQSILVRVATKGSRETLEDPCIVAVRSANILDPNLP